MGGRLRGGLGIGVGAALLALGLAAPAAGEVTASRERSGTATLSVLHAIPAGRGADLVDVYAGPTLVADDLRPGELRSLTVPSGDYVVTVVRDGADPRQPGALLRASDVRVPASANLTAVAHLSAADRPRLTVFANNTTTVGNGKGRLTLRHVAAAPPVDVRTSGSTLLRGIRPGRQADAGLLAGTYRLAVVRSGSPETAARPIEVTIRNQPGRQDMGTNTIVYVWGASADGMLRHTVQNVRIDTQ